MHGRFSCGQEGGFREEERNLRPNGNLRFHLPLCFGGDGGKGREREGTELSRVVMGFSRLQIGLMDDRGRGEGEEVRVQRRLPGGGGKVVEEEEEELVVVMLMPVVELEGGGMYLSRERKRRQDREFGWEGAQRPFCLHRIRAEIPNLIRI